MYSIIDDNSPEEQRKYNEAINRINNMTPQDLGLNPTNDFEEFNMQQIINYDPQKAQEYASKGAMDIFEAGNNFASSFNGTDNSKLKTNSMSIIDQSIENKKKEKFEFDGTYSNIDNNANLTALGRGLKNSSYNQTVEDRIERDRLKKLERNQRVNDGTANILDRVGSALDRWGENSIQGQAQVNANTMEFKQAQNIIYDQADLTKKIDFWEGMQKSISRGENLPVLGEAMKGFDDKKERTIKEKIRNGEPIRQDELDFINHRIDKRNEEAIRGYTIGGEIGKYLPQTIAFMGEMFIGGVGMKALGLTDKLSKVGLNSAKFARSLGAGKGLAKGFGYTSKILANTGVNAAITTITNPASFFATYQERMLNNEMKITDYGTTIFQQSQESPAKAFFKSLGQTYISYFSEGLGGLVTPAFNGIAKGGSVATQQFINVLTRNPQLKKLIDNSAPIFAKAYEKMNGMQTIGKSAEWLKSKVKFDGFIEELSEEVLEDVLNLTVGTNNEERNLKNYASAIFKSPEEWAVLAGVIALQGGALSIAGNMLGGQMEKNGNSIEEIAQVLMTSSENEKNELLNELQLKGQITVNDIRSDEQIKEDLAKDKVQKEFYDKVISIGKSEEEALRISEVARMMFASMGSNTEAKQKWFDNLFITKDVEVEDSAKVAKQLFQSAEMAGSNGNVEEAKKEWQKKGTESKYFKKWFGKSVAKTITGKPLVLYHGTPQKNGEFDTFENSNKYYFSTKEQYAKYFAEDFGANDGLEGKVYPVYLSIQKPLNLTKFKNKNVSAEEFINFLNEKDITLSKETIEAINNLENKSYTPIFRYTRLLNDTDIEQIKSKGYDGITQLEENEFKNKYGVFEKIDDKVFIVFDNTQIKSVDNRGTFDSENANIYFQTGNEKNNTLYRKDGKRVNIEYYNYSNDKKITPLNIKKLNFKNKNLAKDIKKADIKKTVFKDLDKINIKNSKSGITASLSYNNLKKIISTLFGEKKENTTTRLEKEIISNIETIFEKAIPILKHKELKNEHLYDTQIIHRFALPISIGNNTFLTMLTVKERTDFNSANIDEFQIYDLKNKKTLDRYSMSEDLKNKSGQSHNQVSNYIIADLRNFINSNIKKYEQNEIYFQDNIDQNQFEIDLINKARAFADEKYNEEQNKNRKANEKNLTEKQKRYKDTAYSILWFAASHDNNPELSNLIKNKKQLYMLLGNTEQGLNSKVTIRTREKLENIIRELEDEITQNGKPPEWDEFFDTTVSDAELAYRAYKVIIDKEYLNSFDDNAEFKHQEEAIQKSIYEFDYLIQEFKKASKDKNEDLMQKIDLTFLEWSEYADPLIQKDIIDKWYKTINEIKTFDNLDEEELAKGYGEYLSIHNDKKKQNELKHRGYYTKVGEKSMINIVSSKSDASTIIHELAHFFLVGLNEMAKIDDSAKEKIDLINNWLSADGSGYYSTKQHEKFAGSFEAYLYTGKAPTSKLREVFEWFRRMLKEVYAEISMIQDAEISQEAQDLFNKIFSEDEYDDKFAMDIYSKAKNIRVGKTKITNKNIENKLDETQLRHRKASYEILSRATGKTEQYLKLILENKKDDKNVGKKIEELENQLNNLDNKISSSGEFNPEWLEFFDNETLFTSGNDEMLAKEAFLTILNKAYRSYASAYDFDNDLEAQYNYIIKQYKDVENRTATLGAFNIWLDGLKLDEDKEYYNEKFNNEANEIERYENLDEIEKAKQKILKELEFYDDIQDLSKEEKYTKQVRTIINGINFLNAVDKAKLLTNILDVPNKAFMKGRLNDLFDIAKTMQDVNERRILAKKISEEIINTKNIKKGNNTVGKYDYRTNKFFEDLREKNKLTQEKAQEELQARREAIKADEGISFEDKFVNKFLSYKANGLNYTDTHTLQSLYDDILKIKRTAKEVKDEIEFSEKLNNEKAKDEVIEVLHNVKANPKLANDIVKWMGNLYSSMNYIFNKNIAEKYSMEYLNTKTTAWVENEKKRFKNAIKEIYRRNDFTWRDDIINNTNQVKQHYYYKRTFDVTGENVIKVEEIPIKLNKMHYILAYIWNKNKVLSARLENMFGKEQLEDMLSSLTIQDEKLGDYMVNMTTSYYHQVNKIYIEKFGIDLPRVNAYFPSKVEIDKISEFDLLNDFTSQSLGRSFIKQRTKAENVVMDFNDPVEILMGHISNVGKFINEGIEIDKINKIFLDKRVKREIENKFDKQTYEILKSNLATITYKNHAQEYNKADEKFSELANNFIGANVMVKPTIVIKQLLSMTNYSVDMPYNEWFKGLAHALSHPKQTIDFMMKIPYLRARFESGGQNEALKDFMKFNYTKLKNAKFNARLATLKEYLSLNVRYGDIGAIIFGGKPYYDYLIKQGLTKEEAEKRFIESTVRSQQSSEVSTLSAFQRDASKKGANRLFTAYRNASIQYIRAIDDAFVQYQRGEIDTKKLSKVIFNFLILQPYLYEAVGSGTVLQWLLGNGDFIDVLMEILHSIPNGLLGGFGLLGDLAKGIINKVIFGEKVYQSTIPVIADLQRDIQILFKEDLSFEDVVKAFADISKIITGVPLDSISNMAGGVGDIATGKAGKGALRVAGYTKKRAEKITGEK